jgi:hypothetical protein
MSDGRFVGGVTLPAVSAEFIAQLEAAFPVPDIKPGFDRDKAMYDAGARYVIDWIKHHASSVKATGHQLPVGVSITPTGATVRIGS